MKELSDYLTDNQDLALYGVWTICIILIVKSVMVLTFIMTLSNPSLFWILENTLILLFGFMTLGFILDNSPRLIK